MQRADLEQYILETYPAEADRPWAKYPNYQVFRHSAGGKWFALVMDVPKRKLGLSEDGALDVVNVKCGPVMIGELLAEPGFFPAYHMNKDGWLTAALDGSIPEEKLKFLLDRSFDLTKEKPRRKKIPPDRPE